MSESLPQQTDDRTYPAERVKAFADAVVAIAMTLLILPLMDSVAEIAGADRSAAHWFEEHQQQLVSFVLSFVIIAMFWISHHRLFARVERVTTGLVWILMAWLLSIVWLPVATAMSGQMDTADPIVKIVYIGSMVLTSLVSLCLRLYLRAHPALHSVERARFAGGMAVDVAMAVLFALALAIALLVPVIGYAALFVMFLVSPLQRLVARTPGIR